MMEPVRKFSATVVAMVPTYKEATVEGYARTKQDAEAVIRAMYDADELDFDAGEADYDAAQIDEIEFEEPW